MCSCVSVWLIVYLPLSAFSAFHFACVIVNGMYDRYCEQFTYTTTHTHAHTHTHTHTHSHYQSDEVKKTLFGITLGLGAGAPSGDQRNWIGCALCSWCGFSI